jgi:MFS family permease
MRIGKPLAILVGAFTIYPLGFMLFVALTAIPQMLHEIDHPSHDAKPYGFLSSSVSSLAIVCGLLFVFYVLHLFRSPLPERAGRLPWVLAFLVLGPLAELVYWWRYVWPHKSAATLSV